MFIPDKSGQKISLPLSAFKILAMILDPGARNNAIEYHPVEADHLNALAPSAPSTSKTINPLIDLLIFWGQIRSKRQFFYPLRHITNLID